ncbi:MAG TPA: SpoIIE family protein phosphatase [Candidatus Syntrophosphaera sp.]|nr:SpoIIE family protein phosphatase [Candidatus Syntrophosphaera sp.]
MNTSKKTKYLGQQLISFMFIFMLILFLVTFLITRQLAYKVMRSNAEESISNLTETNAQMIDKNLSNIMTIAQELRTVINDDLYTPKQLKRHIHHLLIDNPRLISVCLAYDKPSTKRTQTFYLENQQIRSIPAEDDDYLYKDWFQIPWLSLRPWWSDPWFDNLGSKERVCSYSLPLTIKGKHQGIIRLDTPMESLHRIVKPIRVKKTGFAFMIASNGMIVAHPRDSLAMNYSAFDFANRYGDQELRQICKNAVSGQSGFERFRFEKPGPDVWIAYRPLPSNHWSLLVEVPNSEVFADLHSLSIITTIAFVLAFLIFSGTIWYRTSALNQPLSELVDAIKLAGEGELQSGPEIDSNTYEIQVIAENFEKMKSSLTSHINNLQQVTEEKNRIMAEVAFASIIQRNLIPKNDDASKLPANLKAFGILEPAGAIGGDLYDYFLKDDKHFLFAIADVAGKGVAAAMTMTMMTTLLRTVSSDKDKPEDILHILNTFLVENNPKSDFVTMVLGIIGLESGSCVFSNAGHTPIYQLKAAGGFSKFATTHSTALGFFDNIKITSDVLQLAPGDKILVFTDGVSEAVDRHDKLFGTDGLEKVLNKEAGSSPEETVQAVLAAVGEFADTQKSHDDTTILVVEFLKPLNC